MSESVSGTENILRKCGNYIGICTNNQAEYDGLIKGLTWITSNLREVNLNIYMDSLLIVKQIAGEFKVKNSVLKEKHSKTMKYLERIDSYKIHHVTRNYNEQADELANLAMDKKKEIILNK